MTVKNFITCQKKLAAIVGVSPEHLSAVKNRKANCSAELLQHLHKETKISKFMIVAGNKKRFAKALDDFFKDQRDRKMYHM